MTETTDGGAGATVVRFAPSPTGNLHLGGARTALYNWLHARHVGGAFRLRIEDTDLKRSTPESVAAILDGMRWLGLDWDGEAVFQSKGREQVAALARRLVDEGKAYRCACPPDELERKREEAAARGLPQMYGRACRGRDVPAGVPHAVRFAMPREGSTTFTDLLRGTITVPNGELEDLVLLRSDGQPTYNFNVVCDDHAMGITDVIRGDDHLTNTPKQIRIYEALGWDPPRFAHLPLIAGLSKRKGSDSIQDYMRRGFLPEAVVNYIAKLGWGWKDQEIFTIAELVEKFDIRDVGKSPGQMNEEKLAWLGAEHLRRTPPRELAARLADRVAARGWVPQSAGWLARAVETVQPRSRNLDEAAAMLALYFDAEIAMDPKAEAKFLTPGMRATLGRYRRALDGAPFEKEALEAATAAFLSTEGLALKAIAQPVRVALTGSSVGPGLFETMEVLGREKVLARLSAVAV